MANVMKVLKEEIRRLARREIRQYVLALKKNDAKFRHVVAALKRQVRAVEAQGKILARSARKNGAVVRGAEPTAGLPNIRPTSKTILMIRKKLNISQGELALLVAVTNQAVSHWETAGGRLKLRKNTQARVLAVKKMGKREARRQLDKLVAQKGIKVKSRRRPRFAAALSKA